MNDVVGGCFRYISKPQEIGFYLLAKRFTADIIILLTNWASADTVIVHFPTPALPPSLVKLLVGPT
jgi:hypothetical protein